MSAAREGQSPNCSHKPDPCLAGCGCYCNGCMIERLVDERDALKAALLGIDAALKRSVLLGWVRADDVRSILATSGLVLQ